VGVDDDVRAIGHLADHLRGILLGADIVASSNCLRVEVTCRRNSVSIDGDSRTDSTWRPG
jgi:hypothetical protein